MNRLVHDYDPYGQCCKGSCIKRSGISAHGVGPGTVNLSSDGSLAFNLTAQNNIDETLNQDQMLNGQQQADYQMNADALGILTKVKSKLCKGAIVSIVQCNAEYADDSKYSGDLRRYLESFFGSDVTVETTSGTCQYRTRFWPYPASLDY